MKKLLIIIFMCFLGLLLNSCNYQCFDYHYTFNKIHIYSEGKCYNISKWRDYEGEQIQVDIIGYGLCIFCSNQVILISNNCPICDRGNN